MEQNFFTIDERFALLGALLNRRDLIEHMVLSLDSEHDSGLMELYRSEMSNLTSVLKKLGYEE